MSENNGYCPKCRKKVKKEVKIVFSNKDKKWYEETITSHKCHFEERKEISRPKWGCPDCGRKLKVITGDVYFLNNKWFRNTTESCKCGFKFTQPQEVTRPEWGCPKCGKRLKTERIIKDGIGYIKYSCECGHESLEDTRDPHGIESLEDTRDPYSICPSCGGTLSKEVSTPDGRYGYEFYICSECGYETT